MKRNHNLIISQQMSKLASKSLLFLLAILLAFSTFILYLPVKDHDFVHYDDDEYVTDNPHVQKGLNRQSFKWAFTTTDASNYHPLTWLSHALDCSLFDLEPGPHHLVNLAFHIANTLLLFIVLSQMTKSIWPSAFVAALFALHPLHVESVAWVAERKDVLSSFFWLFTIFAYFHYTRRPNILRYLLTILLFTLGLLAKPMLVTVPFALLLLDYWPLNRLALKRPTAAGETPSGQVINVFLEKLPFFLLAAVSSTVTFLVQKGGGSVPTFAALSLKSRLASSVTSYLAYIAKMFYPAKLAVLYPHPAGGIPVARAVIYGCLLLVTTILLLIYSRRHKYLAVGWLWFLGTLIPVIGIVQVGVQQMADRYTYVPLIGLFIIIVFGLFDLLARLPLHKVIFACLALAALVPLSMLTRLQLAHWKDSFTLFDHTLAVTKDNYVMHNNYANILNKLDRPAEAVEHFKQALKFLPRSPEIHNNYGNALRKLSRYDEAIEHYQLALKFDPDFKVAHYNFGLALAEVGQYDQAVEHYKIYLGPEDGSLAHFDVGTLLAIEGKTEQAIEQYQKALAARPDSVEVLSNLGYALARQGHPDQAVEYYKKALDIDPANIITHGRLALALVSLDQIDEAIAHCRIVLDARPNDYEMHTNLGILLHTTGDLEQAVIHYQKALQINPDFTKARQNLDAALAQMKPQN